MADTSKSYIDRISSWFTGTDRTALLALLIANLLPLLLCIVFSWDVGNLIMFYWWENLVIGLYSILRLVFAQGSLSKAMHSLLKERLKAEAEAMPDAESFPEPSLRAQKFFLVPFFSVHYFFFCFIHGVMLLALLNMSRGNGMLDSPLNGNLLVNFWNSLPVGGALALLVLVASHGVSFVRNYIGNLEYKETNPATEMFHPYKRIVLLHVCIILGGMIVMALGSSTIFVLLFVLFKTIVDAIIHSRSHARASQQDSVLTSQT